MLFYNCVDLRRKAAKVLPNQRVKIKKKKNETYHDFYKLIIKIHFFFEARRQTRQIFTADLGCLLQINNFYCFATDMFN